MSRFFIKTEKNGLYLRSKISNIIGNIIQVMEQIKV